MPTVILTYRKTKQTQTIKDLKLKGYPSSVATSCAWLWLQWKGFVQTDRPTYLPIDLQTYNNRQACRQSYWLTERPTDTKRPIELPKLCGVLLYFARDPMEGGSSRHTDRKTDLQTEQHTYQNLPKLSGVLLCFTLAPMEGGSSTAGVSVHTSYSKGSTFSPDSHYSNLLCSVAYFLFSP